MNVHSLLDEEVSAGLTRKVARAAVAHDDSGNASAYLRALDEALQAAPPPFEGPDYASTYRAASADGHWLAVSLITNAQREGDGATRLWSMAACSENEDQKRLLKQHAIDESRHALAYLAMLDLVFPGAVTPKLRGELNQLSPAYTQVQHPTTGANPAYARTPSVDDFIQMNIAEIRTTIHHLMQRKALAQHCDAAAWPRVKRILDSLLVDELGHVAYTARLIDAQVHALGPIPVHKLFQHRLQDFNQITRHELGDRMFDA